MGKTDRELRALRINEGRFRAGFEALATIDSSGDGGVNRPALGEEHLAARRWLRDRMEDAGLEFRIDSAGNHSGFLPCGPGCALALLLGSHLDSVPNGGRFDGALVLLEALRVVNEAGIRLPVHLEAIDFAEEGTITLLKRPADLRFPGSDHPIEPIIHRWVGDRAWNAHSARTVPGLVCR